MDLTQISCRAGLMDSQPQGEVDLCDSCRTQPGGGLLPMKMLENDTQGTAVPAPCPGTGTGDITKAEGRE